MMIEYYIKNKIIELNWMFMGLFSWLLNLRTVQKTHRYERLMKTNITKDTPEGLKFYDYKGHRCVVLNAPSNTNSVILGIATSHPGDLLKDGLAYKLDMDSQKGGPLYVTFLFMDIDQLKGSLKYVRDNNDFWLCLSNFLLKCGEDGQLLKLRVFSDLNKTDLQEVKFSYVRRQRDLMIQDPNLNKMFTVDNLDLFKSHFHNDTIILVAHVLAFQILNPNKSKEFSTATDSDQIFDLCKTYNPVIPVSHYDQLKDKVVFVKTCHYTSWLPFKRFSKYGLIGHNYD